MRILFATQAWEDYQYWQVNDPKLLRRLNQLIEECRRSPFKGTGKPEPLRGDLKGWWSRRLTQEHRLVYRIAGEGDAQRIEIAQCRFHYN